MSKNGHNFATALPIDVMFGSRVGLWGFWLAQIYYLGAFIHALLSRVTLASAVLSCILMQCRLSVFSHSEKAHTQLTNVFDIFVELWLPMKMTVRSYALSG